MRYQVYFETPDNKELVSEYWTLAEALDKGPTDAKLYNSGEEEGWCVIQHHVEGEWYAEEIEEVNTSTDALIEAVINRLNQMGATSGGGYGYLVLDGKTIRVKDHTHNTRNGKCDINVVIANEDATAGVFVEAKEDLRYNGSSSVDQIIEDILLLI